MPVKSRPKKKAPKKKKVAKKKLKKKLVSHASVVHMVVATMPTKFAMEFMADTLLAYQVRIRRLELKSAVNESEKKPTFWQKVRLFVYGW